jgi:hypothetical protein
VRKRERERKGGKFLKEILDKQREQYINQFFILLQRVKGVGAGKLKN